MSLETMTKIGSYTVPSNTASFTLSNIPQGYTDLVIKLSSKTLHTAEYDLIYFVINGDTTVANYNYARLQGEGNTSTTTTGQTGVFIRTSGSNASAANFFGTAEITIYNYSGNTVKPFSVDSANELNALANALIGLFDGVYSDVAPVTSLTFYPNNATIAANTTVTLYGMKNAAKTAGNSIKATGGNIVFDGTYVYHVFPSTGAFTPTQSIIADVLVVSGGGGGSQNFGGGGGAGGITPLSSQSLSATGYSVTIGAGGAAGTSGTTISATGTVSTFNGTSPTGGTGSKGGGGGQLPIGGASGNGFAAGASGDYTNNNRLQGGSGGGAGAAGSAASNTSPGARGGNGATSAFINQIGISIGFGENISGTNYIGGGGGGGGASFTGNNSGWGPSFYFGPCDGGYGGGGNAGNSDNGRIHGVAGKVNTGSGGGGGAWDNASGVLGLGGAGASGIVIIRYKG